MSWLGCADASAVRLTVAERPAPSAPPPAAPSKPAVEPPESAVTRVEEFAQRRCAAAALSPQAAFAKMLEARVRLCMEHGALFSCSIIHFIGTLVCDEHLAPLAPIVVAVPPVGGDGIVEGTRISAAELAAGLADVAEQMRLAGFVVSAIKVKPPAAGEVFEGRGREIADADDAGAWPGVLAQFKTSGSIVRSAALSACAGAGVPAPYHEPAYSCKIMRDAVSSIKVKAVEAALDCRRSVLATLAERPATSTRVTNGLLVTWAHADIGLLVAPVLLIVDRSDVVALAVAAAVAEWAKTARQAGERPLVVSGPAPKTNHFGFTAGGSAITNAQGEAAARAWANISIAVEECRSRLTNMASPCLLLSEMTDAVQVDVAMAALTALCAQQ